MAMVNLLLDIELNKESETAVAVAQLTIFQKYPEAS